MTAVDSDAAKGLMKKLRSAKFKTKFSKKNNMIIIESAVPVADLLGRLSALAEPA